MSIWRNRKNKSISQEEGLRFFSEEGSQLRIVGQTAVGPCEVSTVHLVMGHVCNGCDHPDGWCMDALFETMIIVRNSDKSWEEWDGRVWRYHLLKEAINGHAKIIEELAVIASSGRDQV